MAQPQRPGGFDMARMTTGAKVVLVTAILLFIDLFFPWQGVDFGEFLGTDLGSANVSGFNGLGVLVAILCIAVIVWEGMVAAGVSINTGTTSPALIGAALAAATALITVISFLTKLDLIKWGAWVGLILALVMTYGAYLRYQESKATAAPPPAG